MTLGALNALTEAISRSYSLVLSPDNEPLTYTTANLRQGRNGVSVDAFSEALSQGQTPVLRLRLKMSDFMSRLVVSSQK